MAGSRPSAFKKGGGFLNNVVGTIIDYEFTTEFPGGDGKKNSKSDFNPLYFVLTVEVDGAEKPAVTTLFVGSADDFEITEDGKQLEPVDETVALRESSDLFRFIASLCEHGFDENELPEDGEPINYSAIIGRRANFVQVPDEAAMAKAAKNYRTSGGKFNEKGQKKGKDGKFYNLTYVAVDAVLGEAAEAPKASTAKGKTAAAAGKNTKPAGGKPNGKAVDLDELAAETLLAIVADNDGEIAKSKLPQQIAKKLGVKHPHRDEVRKLIYTDDFLAGENGWTYNKKTGLISVEA